MYCGVLSLPPGIVSSVMRTRNSNKIIGIQLTSVPMWLIGIKTLVNDLHMASDIWILQAE